MQKSAQDHDAPLWKVKDLDLDTDISDVVFADDETGEYVQLVRDEKGHFIRDGEWSEVKVIRKQGRIKLYSAGPSSFDN